MDAGFWKKSCSNKRIECKDNSKKRHCALAGCPTRTIVFLGPSLDPETAARHLPATYRPPVEQGDIVKALASGPVDTLVIVDGSFGKVPAVRHKELLWALSKGVRVFGAASMGALRAAELAPFGMIGHGFVYRWYRSTLLADDDEVAVAMTPVELGARPLSDALINMRLTFRRAERASVVGPELRRALVDGARRLHFLRRTYRAVFDQARTELPPSLLPELDRLEAWVAAHAVDIKRDDAISLLRLVAQSPAKNESTQSKPFHVTESWAIDLMQSNLWDHVDLQQSRS